jgi:hypothetical protein
MPEAMTELSSAPNCCVSGMSQIAIQEKMNGTEKVLVLKIPLITAHEG